LVTPFLISACQEDQQPLSELLRARSHKTPPRLTGITTTFSPDNITNIHPHQELTPDQHANSPRWMECIVAAVTTLGRCFPPFWVLPAVLVFSTATHHSSLLSFHDRVGAPVTSSPRFLAFPLLRGLASVVRWGRPVVLVVSFFSSTCCCRFFSPFSHSYSQDRSFPRLPPPSFFTPISPLLFFFSRFLVPRLACSARP